MISCRVTFRDDPRSRRVISTRVDAWCSASDRTVSFDYAPRLSLREIRDARSDPDGPSVVVEFEPERGIAFDPPSRPSDLVLVLRLASTIPCETTGAVRERYDGTVAVPWAALRPRGRYRFAFDDGTGEDGGTRLEVIVGDDFEPSGTGSAATERAADRAAAAELDATWRRPTLEWCSANRSRYPPFAARVAGEPARESVPGSPDCDLSGTFGTWVGPYATADWYYEWLSRELLAYGETESTISGERLAIATFRAIAAGIRAAPSAEDFAPPSENMARDAYRALAGIRYARTTGRPDLALVDRAKVACLSAGVPCVATGLVRDPASETDDLRAAEFVVVVPHATFNRATGRGDYGSKGFGSILVVDPRRNCVATGSARRPEAAEFDSRRRYVESRGGSLRTECAFEAGGGYFAHRFVTRLTTGAFEGSAPLAIAGARSERRDGSPVSFVPETPRGLGCSLDEIPGCRLLATPSPNAALETRLARYLPPTPTRSDGVVATDGAPRDCVVVAVVESTDASFGAVARDLAARTGTYLVGVSRSNRGDLYTFGTGTRARRGAG